MDLNYLRSHTTPQNADLNHLRSHGAPQNADLITAGGGMVFAVRTPPKNRAGEFWDRNKRQHFPGNTEFPSGSTSKFSCTQCTFTRTTPHKKMKKSGIAIQTVSEESVPPVLSALLCPGHGFNLPRPPDCEHSHGQNPPRDRSSPLP